MFAYREHHALMQHPGIISTLKNSNDIDIALDNAQSQYSCELPSCGHLHAQPTIFMAGACEHVPACHNGIERVVTGCHSLFSRIKRSFSSFIDQVYSHQV